MSVMQAALTIKCVSVLELDVNDDVISWCYPVNPHPTICKLRGSGKQDFLQTTTTATEEEEEGDGKEEKDVKTTSKSKKSSTSLFYFSRFQNVWQYFLVTPVKLRDNPKIKSITVVVVASNYNPLRYQNMTTLFTQLYVAGASVQPVLKAYLDIFTTGQVKTKVGGFQLTANSDRKAVICSLKPLFEALGAETILVWVAMLTKRRVFVYSKSIKDLMAVVPSFPLLGAWHRQDWSLLRPYVSSASNEAEMKDLMAQAVYVAGFTDENCINREDSYDLLVDLEAKQVIIPQHAKQSFTMTKFHKQTAEAFLTAADSNSDQEMIKTVALKTKELIDNLKSICTTNEESGALQVTRQMLADVKMPTFMDVFLYNIALAEGWAVEE